MLSTLGGLMKTRVFVLFAFLTGTAALAEGFQYICRLSVDGNNGDSADASTTFDSATQTAASRMRVGGYSSVIVKRNLNILGGESIVIRIESNQGMVMTEAQMGAPYVAVYAQPAGTSTTTNVQVFCKLIKEATTPAETP